MMSLGNREGEEGEEGEDAEPEELPERSAVLFLRETGRRDLCFVRLFALLGQRGFFYGSAEFISGSLCLNMRR